MRLEEFLRSYLPRADRRCRIAPAIGVTLLLKNVLLCREPLYGVGEWAARYAPEALGFADTQLPSLNDDRVWHCLDRLFRSDVTSLVLAAMATHVVREFQVDLDELHNDSTTVTFHGVYADATRGRKAGPSDADGHHLGLQQSHEPELKQLLYILTVSGDSQVPLYFQVASGNIVDDQTHCTTWDLLCRLTGRRDFLYVADCKLASTKNIGPYIHQRQGRFLTVLPGFRARTASSGTCCPKVRSSGGTSTTSGMTRARSSIRYSVSVPATLSGAEVIAWSGGRRQSPRNVMPATGIGKTKRALIDLAELRQKLSSPRSRYHQAAKVAEAVQSILKARGVEGRIPSRTSRSGPRRSIVRTVEVTPMPGTDLEGASTRFELEYGIDSVQLAAETCCDGVFPLITNDGLLSELELLLAYKGQPSLEKADLAHEDGLRGCSGLSQGGQPHPGIALCLFSRTVRRVPAGTRGLRRAVD